MKKLVPSLVVLAASSLCAFGAAEVPQGYAAHQTITFSGYNGKTALANFPALLKFSASNFKQNDCSDFAVTDADGNRLPYEIDSVGGGTVSVWVRIPELTKTASVTAWFGRGEVEENPFAVADVWTNVYAAVWHLNGAGGTDSTGHGLTQTHYSNIAPSESDTGAIGRSLKLEKNDKAVLCFATPKETFVDTCLSDVSKITLSGWFNPAVQKPAKAMRLFCWKKDSRYAGFDTFVNTDGKFYMRGDSKDVSWKTAAELGWTKTVWSHLVARFDGMTYAAFLNGVGLPADAGSKTSLITLGDGGNVKALGFGNMGGATETGSDLQYAFQEGGLDELRFYNGVASDDWVKAEYETVMKADFADYADIVWEEVIGKDGTWISDAASANWNDAANWQDGDVADGFGSTATFASPEVKKQTVTLPGDVGLKAVVQEDAVDRTATGGQFKFHGAADVSVAEGGRLALDPGFESDGLVKKGAGELVLPGSLLFNGPLALQAGTLTISNNSEVRGALDIAAGATLNSSAALLKTTGLTGSGAIVGPAAAETRLDVTVNEDQTFGGTTSGKVSLLKNGSYKLTLTGENLFADRLLCREGEVHLAEGASLAPSTTVIFGDTELQNKCGRLTADGEDVVFTQPVGVIRATTTGLTEQGFYATGSQTMTIRNTTLEQRNAGGSQPGQFAVHAHANADRTAGDPTVVFASNKVAYVDVAARVDGLEDDPTRYGNKVIVKDLTATASEKKIRKFTIQNNAKNSLGGTVEFSAVEPLSIDWLDFIGSQSKMILTENSTVRITTAMRFASSAPEQILTCDGDLTLKPGSTLVSNGFPSEYRDAGDKNSVFRIDGATLRLNKWVNAEACEVFGFPDVRVELTEKGGTVNLTPYETGHAPMDRNYFRSPISGEGALRITGEGFQKVPEAIVKASVGPAGGLVASHVALVLDGPFGPDRSLALENGSDLIVTNVSQTLGALTSADGRVAVGTNKTLTVKGVLQESGTLAKRGEGTLALRLADESSSFSGKIAVSEGSLALSAYPAEPVVAEITDGSFEPRVDELPTNDRGKQDKRSAGDAAWLKTNLPDWTFGPDNNGTGICNNDSYFAGFGQIHQGKYCAFVRTDPNKNPKVGPGLVSHAFETTAADAIVRLEFGFNARWYPDPTYGAPNGCSARLGVLIDGEQVYATKTIHSTKDTYTTWTWETLEFTVKAAGSHTLAFTALEPDGDYAGENCEAILDGVKLGMVYPAAGDRKQQLENLALDFASGAKLDLGKNLNASVPGLRLTYDGQRVTGTISAETHPEFVTGEGSLKIQKGLMILIQ